MAENALTTTQQRQLQNLEHQIQKGLGDIYQALKMIHDKQLFRGTHETFQEYCLERFGIGKSRAYHLLKHGQIRGLLSDNPDHSAIAENVREAHTREVADLPPEEAATIIVEASKQTDGKLTAQAVREARETTGDPFGGDPFGDDVPFGTSEEEPISPAGQDAKQDSSPRPPRSGKDKSGESSKPDPEKEFEKLRLKAIKTVEAAMRCFDDLQEIRKNGGHTAAIANCKSLLVSAKNWK